MTSTPINSEIPTESQSNYQTWDQNFPIVTDPTEIQRRDLVRQQLIECLKQSRSFQAKAERLAKRGIDYWAIVDLGIDN